MALPLLAIGEAAAGLFSHKAAPHAKGLLKDASFGSHLRQKLDGAGANGSDLISQLAGMLQAGTPLATIINRIADELSGALARATGNEGNTNRRRVLERALASALAPPGTSPPRQAGTAQVLSLSKSLEVRLRDLLSKITSELKDAGQQNRFSGSVLDAKSARETPAPQQTNHTAGAPAPSGVIPSAESILQHVLAELRSGKGQAPQITAQAPDVLGRMIARAATADAQRTGSAPAPVTTHASPSSSALSPSQLFARLMNVIAQASRENAGHDGGKQSQQFASGKDTITATHHTQSGTAITVGPAFSTALSNASATAVQSAAPATAPVIDPQSLIEQVVKGIVLRNFGTTSEVRMRLQPEHLGDVSLKLTVSGNTISANIVAQNADVRDMLMSNQQQLARSLAEAGLSLGTFSVDVSGGNAGFSQQQSTQHRGLSKAGALHASALGEDGDVWADTRFGPPVLTGPQSLVLNYLA